MDKRTLGAYALALSASILLLAATGGFQAQAQAPARSLAHAEQKHRVDNEELDFELVNETGYPIAHLYMSTSEAEDWGDNILSDTLDSGASAHVSFAPDEDAVLWDMRADWEMSEDAEEQEFVFWSKLKLDEINRITLYYDEDKEKTWAKIE
ncbi:MAG: hypothetical protein ACAI44_17835 [Candidatus Sericytochromatia bacterium]